MSSMFKRNAALQVNRKTQPLSKSTLYGVASSIAFVSASLLLSLSISMSAFAAQRVVVNEAHIEVDDQSQRTQQAALKKALQQVLVKMSGSTSVLDNAGVKAALRAPQALLRSYRFSFDNSRTYYVAEFDQAKLTELLQREMLPVWGDRRPVTIVWVAHDTDEGERLILDESLPSNLSEAIKRTGKERGVPLTLPLMDLTDNVNITTYDVWGRFVEPLRNASVRYAVDNIIGARVYKNDPTIIPELPEDTVPSGTVDEILDELAPAAETTSMARSEINPFDAATDESSANLRNTELNQTESTPRDNSALPFDEVAILGTEQTPEFVAQYESGEDPQSVLPFTMDEFADYAKRAQEGDYALDWVFVGRGKVSYGSIYGDSPELLGRQLIDAYSNYLSSQFAIVGIEASQREELVISVANIGSIGSYANAKAYLNSLSVIETATLVEQSGTVATFSLTLIGTVDDLLNSLKLESKLKPVMDADGQTVNGQNFYWSN